MKDIDLQGSFGLILLWTFIGIMMMALATCPLLSCNKDQGPTSPSPIPPAMHIPPPPAPIVTAPPPAAPTHPSGFLGTVKGGRVKATNISDETLKLIIVCYCDPTGRLEDQVIQDNWESVMVAPGEEVKLSISIPDGAYQCDAVTGMAKPLAIPYYRPDQLVNFSIGGDGPCSTPVCEDCPPPPGCTPPPEPECEFGPAIYNPGPCTWSCPPGPCQPTPEPNFCFDTPSTRAIVCKSEATWNQTKCVWEGDCNCECVLECAEGYELDPQACTCEPLDVCHVSNKGIDGNWSIQENQVKYTPGHASHFDNCPPDYFGQCDGRFDNGAPCQDR